MTLTTLLPHVVSSKQQDHYDIDNSHNDNWAHMKPKNSTNLDRHISNDSTNSTESNGTKNTTETDHDDLTDDDNDDSAGGTSSSTCDFDDPNTSSNTPKSSSEIPILIRPFLTFYYFCYLNIPQPVPYFVDRHHHYDEENNDDVYMIGPEQRIIRPVRRKYHYHNNKSYCFYRYSIDVTFTLVWSMIFTMIDYSTYQILRFVYQTNSLPIPIEKELRMISGSITTILHSTLLITLLAVCFYYNRVTIPNHTNKKKNQSCISLKKKDDDFDEKFPIVQKAKRKEKRDLHKISSLSQTTLVTAPNPTTTTAMATMTGLRSYIPSVPMYCHIKPIWWKDLTDGVLQFCTGYMMYDIMIQFGLDKVYYHDMIWKVTDYIFIGHHLATSAYMISTRLLYAGHLSAMILMFFGEITAPIMNLLRISFTLQQYLKLSSQAYDALIEYRSVYYLTNIIHPYLEYLYAVVYFTIRALLAPILAIHLTYHFLFTKTGRTNVPIYISIIWLALCWSVMLGSYNWVKNCYYIIITGNSTTLE